MSGTKIILCSFATRQILFHQKSKVWASKAMTLLEEKAMPALVFNIYFIYI